MSTMEKARALSPPNRQTSYIRYTSHGTRHFAAVTCTSRVGMRRSAIQANVSWMAQSGLAVMITIS